MLVLKEYQVSAVEDLIQKSTKMLNNLNEGKIVFKSPTGSGKTIIMAEFIQSLMLDYKIDKELSFIWAAPRSLHKQSKEKLEKFYIQNRSVECSEFEELSGNLILANEILFLNWESINQENNIIIKQNEKEFYLDKIIENTKLQGRSLVLIIDESHHHATSLISQKLISNLQPNLTIEVSATPIINNPDEIVTVYLESVKEAGMIKKSAVLNEGFNESITEGEVKNILQEGSDKALLKTALKKRELLKKEFESEGSSVNPLLLIQLPDASAGEDLLKDEVIKILKEDHNITIENNRLGIYLSKDKKNLENIEKNDSELEVLIFKQAIALGWDCPRSQILVLFRHWRSHTFSTQTLGRIMRMPEPSIGHYKNEFLDNSYVFTNLESISIDEDLAGGYLQLFSSQKQTKTKLGIPSAFRLRQREKTRLNSRFIEIFLEQSEIYSLKKKINLNKQKVSIDILKESIHENIDTNKSVSSDTLSFGIENEVELQKVFNNFIFNNLKPFYPEQRSIERLKRAIFYFFKKNLGIDYENDFPKIVNLLLGEANEEHFSNTIDLAKEKYQHEVSNRKEPIQVIDNWDIPESITYSSDVKKMFFNKSIMQPFYSRDLPKTERNFIDLLEKSNKVDWWFKNGDSDQTSFAIKYNQSNDERLFYVDFILKLKTGKLGFFDTKSGFTIMESKYKVDGLNEFLSKDSCFFGGIVTNTDSTNFTGSWKFFNKKGEDLKEGKFDNWDFLEF